MTKTVPVEIPKPLTDPVPAPRLSGKSLAAYAEWIDGWDAALAQANCDKAVIRQINDDAGRAEGATPEIAPCAEQEG